MLLNLNIFLLRKALKIDLISITLKIVLIYLFDYLFKNKDEIIYKLN